MKDESYNIKFKVKYYFNFCGLEKKWENYRVNYRKIFYKVNS